MTEREFAEKMLDALHQLVVATIAAERERCASIVANAATSVRAYNTAAGAALDTARQLIEDPNVLS